MEYDEYFLNPISKLNEMESTYGTIHRVTLTRRSRSLGQHGISYHISKAKINKAAIYHKQARIWYQEEKSIFGERKVIYQIKTANWVMRADYALYYNNKIKHQKYSTYILIFHFILFLAMLYFIYKRHKSTLRNYI